MMMYLQQTVGGCMNSILIRLLQREDQQDFSCHFRNIPIDNRTESGQSLIEFIMTFSFTLGILFLFIKIALNVTDGYMVHYATYMASRTYSVIDVNSNDPSGADDVAAKEAEKIMGKFIDLGFGTFSIKHPTDVTGLPYVGASFDFKKRFTVGLLGGKSELNLKSESFLGKEPTRSTCAYRMCEALKAVGGDCQAGVHFTLFDNGC